MENICLIYNNITSFIKKLATFLFGGYSKKYWFNYNTALSNYRKNRQEGRVFILNYLVFPFLLLPFLISYLVLLVVLTTMIILSLIVLAMFLFIVHPIAFFHFPYKIGVARKNENKKAPSDYVLEFALMPITIIWGTFSYYLKTPFTLVKSENEEEHMVGILSIIALLYMSIILVVLTLLLSVLAIIFLIIIIIPYPLLYIGETFASIFKPGKNK